MDFVCLCGIGLRSFYEQFSHCRTKVLVGDLPCKPIQFSTPEIRNEDDLDQYYTNQ